MKKSGGATPEGEVPQRASRRKIASQRLSVVLTSQEILLEIVLEALEVSWGLDWSYPFGVAHTFARGSK